MKKLLVSTYFWGLGPILILITLGLSPTGAGGISLAATIPSELSSLTMRFAALVVLSSDEKGMTRTPRTRSPCVTCCALTVQPAALNTEANCSAKESTSGLLSNSILSIIVLPANGFNFSIHNGIWDKALGANFSSILSLASRSCSAFSFASAAFAFASAASLCARAIFALDSRSTVAILSFDSCWTMAILSLVLYGINTLTYLFA